MAPRLWARDSAACAGAAGIAGVAVDCFRESAGAAGNANAAAINNAAGTTARICMATFLLGCGNDICFQRFFMGQLLRKACNNFRPWGQCTTRLRFRTIRQTRFSMENPLPMRV
jgi:hypothetical protein